MKKNSNESKNSSVQSQLSQQQTPLLSTLTMDELESVQGGYGGYVGREEGLFGYWWRDGGECSLCWDDDNDQ